MELYLTSDLHLMHSKPFLYEPRGFTSIEEMNGAIIERWNEVVGVEDEVWNLGDFALIDASAAVPYIQKLNGHIKWIAGNHDQPMKIVTITSSCPNVEFVGYATVIKAHKFNFYLSHYPTLTSNMDDDKKPWQRVWNLHGHTHSKEKWDAAVPLAYNACMDAHNCYPIHIDEIISDCRNKFLSLRGE